MIQPLRVRIESDEEYGALVEMSMQEYRTVDEQAAFLIIDGLRRYGYLPPRDARRAPKTTRRPTRGATLPKEGEK